jgi:hypothetical protein
MTREVGSDQLQPIDSRDIKKSLVVPLKYVFARVTLGIHCHEQDMFVWPNVIHVSGAGASRANDVAQNGAYPSSTFKMAEYA